MEQTTSRRTIQFSMNSTRQSAATPSPLVAAHLVLVRRGQHLPPDTGETQTNRKIKAMKLASIIPVFGLALSLLGGFTSPSVAQESRWGSPDEDTVKLISGCRGKVGQLSL